MYIGTHRRDSGTIFGGAKIFYFEILSVEGVFNPPLRHTLSTQIFTLNHTYTNVHKDTFNSKFF